MSNGHTGKVSTHTSVYVQWTHRTVPTHTSAYTAVYYYTEFVLYKNKIKTKTKTKVELNILIYPITNENQF